MYAFSHKGSGEKLFYRRDRLRKHKILLNYILKIFLKLQILPLRVNTDKVFKTPRTHGFKKQGQTSPILHPKRSRKMTEVLYTMIKTGELFDSMPEEVLNRN
ncbi:hypothetical protein LEP1GSC191_3045 [Leptospira borgpetersenii serovar Mini str. 201000851]|uniref:Transposase, IS116/IS110/IS902 domain protein n=1 Tax=Leptospira borgpetersenii str. 200801926 TaxID=1193009 RepID=A0ABN0HXU1_LEPBO|nr:hypothetical protein LEP1GSC128_2666 [Leptospira borgpetersenii str. 200801926]ENO62365.1 hypothetical protein LEP1GSC191_3045 [Leptospira borgpetersenii serovar Mini str. 201000851]